jgi:glutathione S-transferase
MTTPAFTLCGFPLSNYYNKAKLALLEKGLAFDERFVHPRQFAEADYAASPIGKIPFLLTPHGPLSESTAILEYLEAVQPEPRLYPADPYAAAKVRELITFVDLHLELVARELYPQAFFGGTVSEAVVERARKLLKKHAAGFARLAKFAPYVAGDTFTAADCAAYASLPLVSMASRIVLGEDVLAAAGIDWKAYVKTVETRPTAQQVAAARKAAQEALAAGQVAKPMN